jgi:hypothetical protein
MSVRDVATTRSAGRSAWFVVLALTVATIVAAAGLTVAALTSAGGARLPAEPRYEPAPTLEVTVPVRGQGSW